MVERGRNMFSSSRFDSGVYDAREARVYARRRRREVRTVRCWTAGVLTFSTSLSKCPLYTSLLSPMSFLLPRPTVSLYSPRCAQA